MRDRVLGKIIFLSSVMLCVLSANGCSEEPSPVGSLFFPKVGLDSLTVYADSSATYRQPITGNSHTLLVGRYQDFEARMLLQFPIPAIPSSIPESTIVSASIRLIPRYWFRDSTGTLAFTIHKITKTWKETEVQFSDTTLAYESNSSGSFSKIMGPTDTITVPLDTTLVHSWIRTREAHGVIFLPTTASDVVYGFMSIFDFFTDIRPLLIVRYPKADTTGVLDSVVFGSNQEAFVANTVPPAASLQAVTLQAGVADRGIFRFNVDSIPRSANIMNAELTFTRNASQSIRNDLSQDSIFIHLITNMREFPELALSVLATPVGGDSASMFKADIKTIVQQWVTGRPNYGIALRTYGEFTTVDRFVLYGAGDSVYRPQLNILYSIVR